MTPNEMLEFLNRWTESLSLNPISRLGLRIIFAIGLLVVGRLLARFAGSAVERVLQRSSVDATVVAIGRKLAYYSVFGLVILIALSLLGIPTTSLIAVLGAATLAIGLALQDSLSNLASGLLIILLRPYHVGDFVEISDDRGYVRDIRFFHTVLQTRDSRILYVPNSDVMDNNIMNLSRMEWVRLDLVFGIGYGDDLLKAKRILMEIVEADPRVAQDPPPTVGVLELGDSSVNFAVRPFVKEPDLVRVAFDITEQVKMRFDAEGISIPFPQRDVHLFHPN